VVKGCYIMVWLDVEGARMKVVVEVDVLEIKVDKVVSWKGISVAFAASSRPLLADLHAFGPSHESIYRAASQTLG